MFDKITEKLNDIIYWTMHSGAQYENCAPSEHYWNAYYLMEKEIRKARKIAEEALEEVEKIKQNYNKKECKCNLSNEKPLL